MSPVQSSPVHLSPVISYTLPQWQQTDSWWYRITLNSDNTTLTVINSTVAYSGVYEVRFDGLLIHLYSRYCEEAVLDLLRHYPVLKPAVFHVGTTGTYTSEYNTRWISIYGSF